MPSSLYLAVICHPLEVTGAERADLMRQPQALGQEQLELAAEPLAPMAQVGALMGNSCWKNVSPVKCWKYGS